MLFLLNNPVIAFLIVAALGLTVLTTIKIVNEIKLNKELGLKHASMRVAGKEKGIFGKRMSLLGAQAVAPVAIIVIAFVAGVNLQADVSPNQYQSVSGSDDIIQLFNDFNEKFNSGYQRAWFNAVDDLEMAMDGGAEKTDEFTGSDDYSDTNNQVIGVSEMEDVLTDGMYIYTKTNNGIQITLAYTNETKIENFSLYKEIMYSDDYCSEEFFYPIGMYVDEARLIVIGNQYKQNCNQYDDQEKPMYDIWWGGYYNSTNIQVKVYDKSNDFELAQEYEMSGYFTGTRKIDNNLYVVTNNYIPFYQEDINVDDYLPYYSVNGDQTVASYDEINYVEGTNPNAFTSFYGIDLEEETVEMEVVLGDSGYNLYVSHNNIYLVGSVYYFWPLLDVIEVENPVQSYKTAIMRVAIEGEEDILEFDGIGYVEGHTLNQFSMDEHEGHLRIATTTGWWGEDINNRITILNEDLEVVGELENLGKPGETIQSTRFVGDYGYMVTFLRTDPFYVIDLSDPTNPKTEGELEITGFSSYLQPLGENYMLGIGFEASDEGVTTGLKVSVYDITDKANPIVFDEVIFDYSEFGYAWSSATYEHKDLLVSLSKGIIALPFSTWEYDQVEGKSTYNSGIIVLKFDLENGFEKKTVDNKIVADHEFVQHEENADWDCYVRKAKFIGEYFYSISNKYIKVSKIENTEEILGSVTLTEE